VIRDSSMGLATQLIDPIVRLNDSVWRRNSVRLALVEMLRLRNARAVNCVFCKAARYDVARQDGLTEDKVAQIDDGFAGERALEVEKTGARFRRCVPARSRAFRSAADRAAARALLRRSRSATWRWRWPHSTRVRSVPSASVACRSSCR
jgi:hypothetical protein